MMYNFDMVLSPHIIAGAALGANFPATSWSFYLLPLAAIALHHALDRVPHYDYKIKPFSLVVALKVFADLAFGILTIWVIYRFFNPAINIYLTALGAFFGVFPDGLLLISFFLPGKLANQYQNFHKFLHHRRQIVYPVRSKTPQTSADTFAYWTSNGVNGEEEKKAISWTGPHTIHKVEQFDKSELFKIGVGAGLLTQIIAVIIAIYFLI